MFDTLLFTSAYRAQCVSSLLAGINQPMGIPYVKNDKFTAFIT